MQFIPSQNQKPNPKLQQFQQEMNELQEGYQYNLVPELSVSSRGIFPIIGVHDKVPEKKNVKGFVKKEKDGK